MNRWLLRICVLLMVAAATHVIVLFAAPYVIMGVAMRRISQNGAVNTAVFGPRATAAARTIVRPSPDLLYGTCVFDLDGGPLRLRAEVPSAYWSISGFAANTDNFFVINNRQLEQPAVDIILKLPDQKVSPPSGARVVDSPSRRGIVLTRSLIVNESDLPEVDRLRHTLTCERY